jgi:hypothetical protein
MGDTGTDPVDDDRTTQPLAGETMKDGVQAPGLVFIAVAVTAFVVCIASFALRQAGMGVGAAIVALLAAGAALAWLTTEGRRVRQLQREGSRTRRGDRTRR